MCSLSRPIVAVATIVCLSSIAFAQSHFVFTSLTGSNATVIIPTSANPNISGTPLASGDEIGVFTPGGLCVGAVVWSGSSAAIAVWGASSSPPFPGIQSGETMLYRVWRSSTNTEFPTVVVSYSTAPPATQWDGLYHQDGIYVLSTLTASAGPVTRTVTVSSGWNMISVPDQASDMSVSALFPDAVPPAYGFNNGYVSASTLSVGMGYWLKFPGAKTYNITGTAVRPANIGVIAGWNMIGAFDFDYATASITPLSMVVSPYYGYNNGYVAATTLTGGKGYWVKTSSGGTLSLQAPSGKLVGGLEAAGEAANAGSITVEIKDNSGNAGVLYLADGAKISELPPLPPQGIFDVRFASNSNVENIGADRHEILLSSVVYPLRIVVRGTNGKELWIDDAHGSVIVSERLEEGKEVTIVQNLSKVVLSEKSRSADIPQQYELSQNYPNPFNPTTVIRFALPEAGRVRLSIFNVLGEQVAELVNGEREAGTHQVEFNVGSVPSGIYFYRLEAGSFVATKKLVVVK